LGESVAANAKKTRKTKGDIVSLELVQPADDKNVRFSPSSTTQLEISFNAKKPNSRRVLLNKDVWTDLGFGHLLDGKACRHLEVCLKFSPTDEITITSKKLGTSRAIELELIEWLNELFDTRVELWEAHGLRQGPETQGQASFSIHQDTEEDEDVQYTVVVKLTADVPGKPPSAMRIVGQAIDFEYGPTAGASATFRFNEVANLGEGTEDKLRQRWMLLQSRRRRHHPSPLCRRRARRVAPLCSASCVAKRFTVDIQPKPDFVAHRRSIDRV
jgi:hypothetical protein